jgi:cation transport ATPase
MHWISAFFKDHYGKPSSMRIALLVPIALVFGVWTYMSLKLMVMQDIPSGVCVMLLGLVGGTIGKAAFEKSTSTTETSSQITPEGASTSMSKTSESIPAPVEAGEAVATVRKKRGK